MNTAKLGEEFEKFKEDSLKEIVSTSRGDFTVYTIGKGDPTVLFLPGGMADRELFFLHMKALSSYGRIITLKYPYISRISEYVD